mgnify:CR=1 FL=1
MTRIDETVAFIPVRIAVLTVSDSRGLSEDRFSLEQTGFTISR